VPQKLSRYIEVDSIGDTFPRICVRCSNVKMFGGESARTCGRVAQEHLAITLGQRQLVLLFTSSHATLSSLLPQGCHWVD